MTQEELTITALLTVMTPDINQVREELSCIENLLRSNFRLHNLFSSEPRQMLLSSF